MKTKLFLFAALLISTITFSQTSKKGYDYYKASSDNKTNKAELTDAMAKDVENFEKKAARKGRNPQTGKEIKSANLTNNLNIRKRPGRSQGDPVPGIGITTEQGNTKGQNNRGKAQDHNASRSNTTSSKIDTNPIENNKSNSNGKRKRPGRTKTDSNNSNIKQEFTISKDLHKRKRPGRTKATDYNSSRSNRTTNN